MHLVIISGSVFGTVDLVADEAPCVRRRVCRLAVASAGARRAAGLGARGPAGVAARPPVWASWIVWCRCFIPCATVSRCLPGCLRGDRAGRLGLRRHLLPGGEQMRELLLELQGREAQPMLRLDASETVTPDTDAGACAGADTSAPTSPRQLSRSGRRWPAGSGRPHEQQNLPVLNLQPAECLELLQQLLMLWRELLSIGFEYPCDSCTQGRRPSSSV